MKERASLFALFSLLVAALVLVSPARAETVVILNAEQSASETSSSSLLRIYAMKKRYWSSGDSIRVFVLPNNSDSHREFVNQYLKMQPHQLNRLWHKLVFSGTGGKPEVVESAQDMLRRVESTPGAIGYVDSDQVDLSDSTVVVANDD